MESLKNLQNKYKLYGNLMCTNSDNLTLEGDFYSQSFQYIKASVIPCLDEGETSKCASRQTVNDFFNRKYMQVLFSDTYVDIKDNE